MSRPRSNPRRAIALVAVATVLLLGAFSHAGAQRPRVYAITGATVITEPGTTIENATVVLRDGLIEAVGSEVTVPADAESLDGEGLTVYAGWIDAYTTLALRPPRQQEEGGGRQQGPRPPGTREEPRPGTGHPISRVHPEYTVTEELIGDDDTVGRYRDLGFTAALVVPHDGIYRGRSAVIALRSGNPRQLVIRADVAQNVGFQAGNFGGGYPGSLLGVISTLRQVLLDTQRAATWAESYARNPAGIPRPEHVDAYEALQPVLAGDQPVIFEAGNNRATERSLGITQEFNLQAVIRGNGREYEIAEMLAEAQVPVIVPVDYPDKPDVGEGPDADLDLSLATLREWDRAPGNAAALEEAGVLFALTADGLGSPMDFATNVRKAIEAGLPEARALAAVTTAPARILGVDAVLGTVEAGKIANLVVATGPPFGEETEIRHVFVDGFHTKVEERQPAGDPDAEVDPRGRWVVTMSGGEFSTEMTWTIEGSQGAYSGNVEGEMGFMPFDSVELEGDTMTVSIPSPMGMFEITVVIDGNRLSGSLDLPEQGISMGIRGRRTSGPGAVAIADHGGMK